MLFLAIDYLRVIYSGTNNFIDENIQKIVFTLNLDREALIDNIFIYHNVNNNSLLTPTYDKVKIKANIIARECLHDKHVEIKPCFGENGKISSDV